MNKIILSFIFTFLAGLSTLLGTIIIIFKKNKNKNILISSLAFASSVMLTISICDLIPESITILKTNNQGIFVIIISFISMIVGIIISMLIGKYLPSNNNDNLYKVGIISMIAIILHNIPEGITTFLASSTNISLGLSLTLAIAMHNIPEGISIAVPIYYSTKSKKKSFYYTLISALSEPFGALLAYLFLYKIINNLIMGIILSLISGIMIYISLCELLKESLSYNNKKLTLIFFFVGILFVVIYFILDKINILCYY